MKKRDLLSSAALMAFLPLLSGCFTGIEGTPKISEKDVRRQVVLSTPEQEFAAPLRPASFGEWNAGREFRVADSRISLALDGRAAVAEGDTIVFDGIRHVPSVMGDSATILVFKVAASPMESVTYRVDAPYSQLVARESFTLPFSVDLVLVAEADALLRGKSLYILSSLWVDRDGKATDGQKYIPVTVDSVVPGNDRYPLQVNFTTADHREAAVLMTVESSGFSTRNFADLFAFTDPHLRYPAITDSVWRYIVNGDLTVGMTREECRLSVGIPGDVKKGHNGSYYYERWTFDNGSYLIFEDGLLESFRK